MTTNLSYDHGAAPTKLIGETVGAFFDRIAALHADRPALIVRHQNIRWSYAELARHVDTLAAGLLGMGLEPGDRIGIWAPNCAEWVLMQFATAKAGLILVNINPAYRTAELEYALNKAECKALTTAPALKTSDYIAMLNALAPELASAAPGKLASRKLPHLRWVIRLGEAATPGMLNFDAVSARADSGARQRLAALAPNLQFDDPINIQFTSGTTGFPKGATLTHRNILNNGFFIGEAMRLTPEDRLCIPVPLYHCFGMVLGNLACATHGAAIVYPNDAFDPLTVLQTVQDERCTGLHGVPTMFIAELNHPRFKEFDLSSLRTGIMAGSPCPIEVMKRVVSEMHMDEVTIAYGMTETSPVSTQSSTADPIERRVSTVGRVQPHIEIKIVDAEGRIAPRATAGEFCTRGYSVMLGYWNDDERTREAIDRAGWMHTGDLATMDDEGYVNIVGRLKDMVIRGGENVYPREIEEFLYRHPNVQDVQVIGVPDAKYGEEICAWIRLREAAAKEAATGPAASAAIEAEIRAFCKGQIAHYKIPRYIRFVDEFPMTVTGKVQKFIMREAMIKELNLAEQKTA